MKITIEGPQGCGKTQIGNALNKAINELRNKFPGLSACFRPGSRFKLHSELGNTGNEVWLLEEPSAPQTVIPLSAALPAPGGAEWTARTVKDGITEAGRELLSGRSIRAFENSPSSGFFNAKDCYSSAEAAIRAELQKGNRVFRKLPGGDPVEVVSDNVQLETYAQAEARIADLPADAFGKADRVVTGRPEAWKPQDQSFTKPAAPSDAVCRICSGGPGNHGVCLCGAHAYEDIEQPPAAGLIPLGTNVTASGQKIEVLRNDLTEGRPIVARVYRPDGTYFLAEYQANGMPHGGLDETMKLVGHLPPEPVKPREVWLRFKGDHVVSHQSPWETDHEGYQLFREVTPDTRKQYHAWVNDDGDIVASSPSNQEWGEFHGYRKATLVERKP